MQLKFNEVLKTGLAAKHAYRYLHFKVVSVHLDADVGDGPLQEAGRPQHQHQLQVPRKRSLCETRVSPLTPQLLHVCLIHLFTQAPRHLCVYLSIYL